MKWEVKVWVMSRVEKEVVVVLNKRILMVVRMAERATIVLKTTPMLEMDPVVKTLMEEK